MFDRMSKSFGIRQQSFRAVAFSQAVSNGRDHREPRTSVDRHRMRSHVHVAFNGFGVAAIATHHAQVFHEIALVRQRCFQVAGVQQALQCLVVAAEMTMDFAHRLQDVDLNDGLAGLLGRF